MGIHKKIFPVAKMPWHDDDHKFGESSEMTWDDVAQKLVPLIEDLEEDFKRQGFKRFEPPPIDRFIGTVSLIDNSGHPKGKCYYCGFEAIYAFQGRLYCGPCWIEMDESD